MFPIVSFNDLMRTEKVKKFSEQEDLRRKLFYLNHGTTEQARLLVKKDPMLYLHCSMEHKSNVVIFKDAMSKKSRKHVFKAAPPSIKENDALMAETLLLYPKLFGMAPLKYRRNKKFVMELFDFMFGEELYDCVLKLSKTLLRDHEILTLYVRRVFVGFILQSIHRVPDIATNMDLLGGVLEKAKTYDKNIDPLMKLVPPAFLSDRETALRLLKMNGEVYRFMPAELQQDQKVFDAACDARFNALSIAPDFCHRNAVLRYSGCLANAPELDFDVDLLTQAFAVSPDGFKYARTPIRMNPTVAGTALKAGLKLRDLPLEHLQDDEFVREHFDILTSYTFVHKAFFHMPPSITQDKNVLKKIVAQTPFMIPNVSIELLGGTDWIYVLARCEVAELSPLVASSVSLSDVFSLVVPLLKEARSDALGANALVFSKAPKKRRREVGVKDMPAEVVRVVVSFLIPCDYADYRNAIENFEGAMQVSFTALP